MRPGGRHAVIRVEVTETCIRAVISVTAYDKCFVYRQIVLVHEFQQSSQRKSVKSRTFVGCIPKMLQKINNRKQDLVPASLLSTCLHTKEVIKLITFLFYLFYLFASIIYLKRKTGNQKPTGSRQAPRRKTRRNASRSN